jgi:kynurenine formamidase
MNIIDLSYKIYTGMPSIPSDKHVKTDIKEISNIAKDGIERHQVLMSCHSGTHMDAPIHMLEGGSPVGAISPDNFFGRATKIVALKKEDEEISASDVNLNGRKDIDFLIVQTGWESNWGKPVYYERHPHFSSDAMDYLSNLPLRGILMDLPNPDRHDDITYPTHKIWLKKKSFLVENLCNLGKITDPFFYLVIASLNLSDAEAAPVRCFAIEGFE